MNRKILFIDDEEHVLTSIRRSLNKWFKEKAITPYMANSAHEAIAYVRDHGKDIAVIVSDQRMPDLKGNEIIKLINEKYPDIISIILSGHSDMKDMKNIIASNVFSFLLKPWDSDQLKSEIEKALNQFTLKIENRMLKNRIDKELMLAGEFQEAIMSSTLKQDLPIPVTVTYIPSVSTGVSGDYYEIIKLSDDSLVVLLGDVSGHGIKPAFITMALKSIINYEYFHLNNNSQFQPMFFTSWLNKRLYEYLKQFPDLFLTLSCIYIDLSRKICTITNAGQPYPILIEDNRIEELKSDNLVLGVDDSTEFDQISIPIHSDTRIFLSSDGIHPVGNESNSYSKKDFNHLMTEFRDKLWDHKGLIKRIERDYLLTPFDDDVTIISIEFKKKE